ncbi:MAG: hypothetical protein HY553_16810 [Elusimicrobia bacterium]|nr:hypothetical protein [Elusimicrobiota bacterium]
MTLALAALLFVSGAAAQTSPPPPAPAAKPKPHCPCEHAYWKPLTEKGKAAEEYWRARRRFKSTRVVSSTFFLFAYALRDLNTINEAENSYAAAQSELASARARAESLGAVKVTDDLEGPIEFKLVEGVDYTVTPPR